MMKRISLMGRKRTRDLGEQSGDLSIEATELKKEELLSMKMEKINDKLNENAKKSGTLLSMPITQILMDENQPRKTINNIDLLADSIKQQGVIQPIIVRSNPNKSAKKYLVIAGERRLRAAAMAGKSTIPCILREEDDTNTLLIQLLENAQREQVAPLEEAKSIKKLIDHMKLSKQEIAKELGQPPSWVSMRLSLLNASEKIKHLIQKRHIEDFRTIHELRKLEEEHPEKAKKIIKKIQTNTLRGSYRSHIKEARQNKTYEIKSDNNITQNILSDLHYDKKTEILTIINSQQNNIQLKVNQTKLKAILQNSLNNLS